ncbi:hypothetical protein FRX31_006409 [Thalictrum thalictroides]|uniref:Uncharacterized protein n=1 Tax=Thalictrum thalictroides TaxID=46969 RepID=A0A7J6X3N9_THATH|nr:hypothetical protein FRX31_006409 [Thalictrum thalictroides]
MDVVRSDPPIPGKTVDKAKPPMSWNFLFQKGNAGKLKTTLNLFTLVIIDGIAEVPDEIVEKGHHEWEDYLVGCGTNKNQALRWLEEGDNEEDNITDLVVYQEPEVNIIQPQKEVDEVQQANNDKMEALTVIVAEDQVGEIIENVPEEVVIVTTTAMIIEEEFNQPSTTFVVGHECKVTDEGPFLLQAIFVEVPIEEAITVEEMERYNMEREKYQALVDEEMKDLILKWILMKRLRVLKII